MAISLLILPYIHHIYIYIYIYIFIYGPGQLYKCAISICFSKLLRYLYVTYMCSDGQNHYMYTVYTWHFWQGNHPVYGQSYIRCVQIVLAKPIYDICDLYATYVSQWVLVRHLHVTANTSPTCHKVCVSQWVLVRHLHVTASVTPEHGGCFKPEGA